eukprot:TRINITY_DN78867_c0_g1_i1.p1 TRINITY_DN78867_c0_g1~~TRINITY_DN78867_c0_g1_i1.p1  ORF type:complete len:253 (-),score=35.07 TRINITY_DN78867_c0_g1_i1:75-833(-)
MLRPMPPGIYHGLDEDAFGTRQMEAPLGRFAANKSASSAFSASSTALSQSLPGFSLPQSLPGFSVPDDEWLTLETRWNREMQKDHDLPLWPQLSQRCKSAIPQKLEWSQLHVRASNATSSREIDRDLLTPMKVQISEDSKSSCFGSPYSSSHLSNASQFAGASAAALSQLRTAEAFLSDISLAQPPPVPDFCRAVQEQPEFSNVASVGSFGHPHSCAEPCKYAQKRAGCKDGSACVRCHLCFWAKSASKRRR